MINKINSNRLVSAVSLLHQNQKTDGKNIITEYPQQVSLSQFPSFAGNKPLTETEQCKQMLLKARNYRGGLMFPMKDDISGIMEAIKPFETTLKKPELLDKLLYYSHEVEAGACSAKNVKDYFKFLNGQPAQTQKRFAEWMSGNIPKYMDNMFEGLKEGKISIKDINYVAKHVQGNEAQIAFNTILYLFSQNPELITYKGIISKKLSSIEGLRSAGPELADFARGKKAKSFTKLLSLVNKKNAEAFVRGLIYPSLPTTTKPIEKLASIINKHNATQLFESIVKIGIRATVY